MQPSARTAIKGRVLQLTKMSVAEVQNNTPGAANAPARRGAAEEAKRHDVDEDELLAATEDDMAAEGGSKHCC